ncbi:GNAT family N-acetyltransferase [Streptomyces sp. NPDC008079]|uniref:GNAT family N-acetyltransferase n=1 Tax=Streptomyces sp. NPDC008079 TaxID=3364806 RepID=UPI0036E44443
MTTELRVLERDDWEEFYGRLERAFGGPAEPPEERGLWRELTELERSLAVWDGGEIVGTAGAFSFRVTVPGGASLPAAGVTMVSVQPTHRRRGVLTSMMRRQLDDVREGPEPLAVLTASEPAIYGRFGYGTGTLQLRGNVDTTRTAVRALPGVDDVRLRLVPLEAAGEACEAVYARVVPTRPGMLARRPGWERVPLLDAPASRDGAGERLCVVAEADGEVRGYARYSVKLSWSSFGPDNIVKLSDVEALDPVVYAALWRYLSSIDLTSRVAFYNRPVDDPLLHLLSDVRRGELAFRDSLHVRLVNLGEALEARTYTAPVDVVLEVEDAFCPWNAGRWRLSGDAKGATCERTADAADLALSVKELGAAYLGGPTLRGQAEAGLVRELRPGALAEASRAFRGDVEPWLPHGF